MSENSSGKKYYLFIKTGWNRWAPVDRTFSSWLEAERFFEENKEMWDTTRHRILSSEEIEKIKQRNIARYEKRQRVKKKVKTTLKSAVKNLLVNADKSVKPVEKNVHPFKTPSSGGDIGSFGFVHPPDVVKPAKLSKVSIPKQKLESRFYFNPSPSFEFKIYRPPVFESRKIRKRKKKRR
ncbi:MAG: hypothetical protein DRN05_04330 [Thermoplasmata archaeon]|nr:MAG: hypothetical protein DRN05_04330 [Thermoplasmata archaeon]